MKRTPYKAQDFKIYCVLNLDKISQDTKTDILLQATFQAKIVDFNDMCLPIMTQLCVNRMIIT